MHSELLSDSESSVQQFEAFADNSHSQLFGVNEHDFLSVTKRSDAFRF